MKFPLFLVFALLAAPAASSFAQTSSSAANFVSDAPDASASSAPSSERAVSSAALLRAERLVTRPVVPFSSVGIAVKLGLAGVGFDVATPLARRVNLRAGASFFGGGTSFASNGLNVNGKLDLQNAAVSVDVYPFHNAFRISPGITFYNKSQLAATLQVPAGGTFSLNDADYTSSVDDPVHGTAALSFGKAVAPRLTVGFGNIIPRGSKHISFPFEAGFQYISDPVVKLSLAGSVCTADGCDKIEQNAEAQANVAAQQTQLTRDLNPLRFYPVVSFGVSYKFGHKSE